MNKWIKRIIWQINHNLVWWFIFYNNLLIDISKQHNVNQISVCILGKHSIWDDCRKPLSLPKILDGRFYRNIQPNRKTPGGIQATCTSCLGIISGTTKSTGNFLSHIKRRHKEILASCQIYCSAKGVSDSKLAVAFNTPFRIPPIRRHRSSSPPPLPSLAVRNYLSHLRSSKKYQTLPSKMPRIPNFISIRYDSSSRSHHSGSSRYSKVGDNNNSVGLNLFKSHNYMKN